jgi:hypothetical protein
MPAAIGESRGPHNWVQGAHRNASGSSRAVAGRAPRPAPIIAVYLPKCDRRGQTKLMRVVVTRISQDGTMRRRMVDTAASGDVGPWEELTARALAAPPPYHPVPGGPVYHLRVDDQVVLVAEHDLSGPLYDLVTAVLAIGEAPH